LSRINIHGLSRDIPDPIKREIRQKCGFGCVNCGKALYQYEHVDPEFKDARSHDPSRIVLLCGGCHDLVTRGLLSKDTIKLRALTPKCTELGFSFGPFDIGNQPPEVVLGTITARNCKTLIRITGDDVFSIAAPAQLGQPFILNARFFDIGSNPILDIVENEWRSALNSWDVEVVGSRIRIRRAPGDLVLILRSEPPRRIVIERLEMLHKGIRLQCSEGTEFQVVSPDGSTIRANGVIQSDDWLVGIDADATGIRMGLGGTMRFGGPEVLVGPSTAPPLIARQTLRRNAPCPCGSGRKFKRCHGSLA
jgi:hypothetical protein